MISDSDIELWNAVRNDNEAAFTILFNRHWELLYHTSFRYLKDHEVSEEIVHDIFLSIWNRRKTLEINLLKNFLLKSVRYQVYSRAKASKLTVTLTDQSAYENEAFEANQGEIRMIAVELEWELDRHLSQLPLRCREIFKMSRIKNLSNQEIAVELGISKRSVENQITLASKHLRHSFGFIAAIT